MKYLVAQLSEREKIIVKLKASLYSLSIDELVKRAVDKSDFEIEVMDCLYCENQKTEVRNKLKPFLETIQNQEVRIDITRYPMNTCPNCNAEYDDMNVSRYVAELVRFEVLNCLKTGKKLPERIRFNELIKM